MIRIERADGWTLVEHRDHARLAGQFAEQWLHPDFLTPEPRGGVLTAVSRHDDAWAVRDASPCLTKQGLPSAFSRELVGKYSAFEEIDFLEYIAVRAAATEAVAEDDPLAAIAISMHTVNLLTEQADLDTLAPEHRPVHARFVAGQRERQCELAGLHLARGGDPRHITPQALRHAFEFLQACDSLSLLTCVDFPTDANLRHTHPRTSGERVTLRCSPLGERTFRVAPYPFVDDELSFTVPSRHVQKGSWRDLDTFRAAYQHAPVEQLRVRLVR